MKDFDLDSHEDPPWTSGVKTAPELVEGKTGEHLARFLVKVDALELKATGDLMAWLEVQLDAAMLWPIHQVFHGRGIAPIMRGPRHQLGEQGMFIDFAADVAWLQSRWPWHQPRYRLLRAVFKEVPGTSSWWTLLRKQFDQAGSRNARSWTIAFKLDDFQRLDLRTIQTKKTQLLFEELHGARFGALCDALTQSVIGSPDKSGRTSPRETANRRARIWRTHMLSGGSYRATAELWEKLSGEKRSKQALRQQVEKAEPVARQLRIEQARLNTRATPDVDPAVIPKV